MTWTAVAAQVVVPALLVTAAVGGTAAGLRHLGRAGRRKGYRGPFLVAGLVVLVAAMIVAASSVLVTDADDMMTSVGLTTIVGGAGGLVVGRAVVALLPRRPGRVDGVRATAVPYRGIAWVLGAAALTAAVVGLRTGLDLGAFGLVLLLSVLTGLSAAMARRARVPQAAGVTELVADPAAVLLLRGFADDGRIFSESDARRSRRGVRRWLGAVVVDREADVLSAERYLGPAVAEVVGPLVGLGDPADYLPPEGTMRRYYAPDSAWRAEVARLVAQVRAVLVVVTRSTASLDWELRHVREVSAQERMFLVRPPARSDVGLGRLGRWIEDRRFGSAAVDWATLVDDLRALGYRLPAADPGPGTVLGFDGDGRAQVLVSGADTARAYAASIADRLGRRRDGPEADCAP